MFFGGRQRQAVQSLNKSVNEITEEIVNARAVENQVIG